MPKHTVGDFKFREIFLGEGKSLHVMNISTKHQALYSDVSSKCYAWVKNNGMCYKKMIFQRNYIENKRNLECIKIEAAHIITDAMKLCSIQKLYDDTGIQTLQKRRNNHKFFQIYKILNGLKPQYLQSLIPQRAQNISRHQLRNMNNFNVPPSCTVSHANSFCHQPSEIGIL